ncbi:hypothetical protein EJ05DRAFT_470441 [Pseudovirgaria hyperparasitica]|uniref:Sorting nexin-4 n=1 Tax=Pseudovirgaria hyperparasitica TaxID=470096 RepID=A0A6A6VRI1_9PEZI|nr:uncharacterized protein EJ05DRAFT_470441 [Pseudovirgaria hyperparasitica]KAF2753212.1 hypothetical protein EJ05DRAFT_470441 [Pseudovirgaria hyperparasitica]
MGGRPSRETTTRRFKPDILEYRAKMEDLDGQLVVIVGEPQKENDGTKDAFVSYLVTTKSDYQSFNKREFSVRRRFTDFQFLYRILANVWGGCAVPPLPDKHNMEYVRGDRFGPDFTNRRSYSLNRFMKRLTLHPLLRRQPILLEFLESPDWNATMKTRPKAMTMTDQNAGSGGLLDSIADTFLNTFSKVHKPDKRFIEVKEKANKLDEDLGNVEKVTARVARRQGDLEADYSDLAQQFQKLVTLESGVEQPLTAFHASLEETSQGFRFLKEHTDQNYLGSLRDMEAYILAVKALLKAREQKQLDFEGLTDYLNKAAYERDQLASQHGSSGLGASGFLRAKLEDVRGVDHEQSRRDRVRKLELEIERLQLNVEEAKKASETADESTVKEIADFERIKAVEFKDTLGDLADTHIAFFKGTIDTWEKFVDDMEKWENEAKERSEVAKAKPMSSAGPRSRELPTR